MDVPIPAHMCLPIDELQRRAEEMEYSELLDQVTHRQLSRHLPADIMVLATIMHQCADSSVPGIVLAVSCLASLQLSHGVFYRVGLLPSSCRMFLCANVKIDFLVLLTNIT
jgi:hypothetical protein